MVHVQVWKEWRNYDCSNGGASSWGRGATCAEVLFGKTWGDYCKVGENGGASSWGRGATCAEVLFGKTWGDYCKVGENGGASSWGRGATCADVLFGKSWGDYCKVSENGGASSCGRGATCANVLFGKLWGDYCKVGDMWSVCLLLGSKRWGRFKYRRTGEIKTAAIGGVLLVQMSYLGTIVSSLQERY